MSVMSVARVRPLGRAWLPVLEEEAASPFPSDGRLSGVARGVDARLLLAALYGQSQHWCRNLYYAIYFFSYWAVYIASAVLLYFVCIEVFRSALSAFPGLMKFGIVIFRWAVLVSVIVSFSTISFAHRGLRLIPDIAVRPDALGEHS